MFACDYLAKSLVSTSDELGDLDWDVSLSLYVTETTRTRAPPWNRFQLQYQFTQHLLSALHLRPHLSNPHLRCADVLVSVALSFFSKVSTIPPHKEPFLCGFLHKVYRDGPHTHKQALVPKESQRKVINGNFFLLSLAYLFMALIRSEGFRGILS